jgi:SAM-dependent methyltransferase
MTSPDPLASAGWSRYWSAGHEHSCPTSFDGFYGPALRAFWQRQAAVLRPDDVVLEFGCGNGGLLRFLLSQFAPGRAPMLHGVDAAELKPSWLQGLTAERVRLHARTAFDGTPLKDASVSLAASLFGIEYGLSEPTWNELFRVLRPAARVAFVLHKRGSRLDTVAADEVAIAGAALAADGVLAAAQALLPYLGQAVTEAGRAALRTNPEAEAARQRFNSAVEALQALGQLLNHGEYVHDILGAATRMLGEQPAALLPARLAGLRDRIVDHLARIEALRASALDAGGVAAVRMRLQAAGFAVAEPATIAEQDYEMGWVLEGTRGNAG